MVRNNRFPQNIKKNVQNDMILKKIFEEKSNTHSL